MKYKKPLLCLFVIFAMVLSVVINNPIIVPSALEDEEITEELTKEIEEEVEKEPEEEVKEKVEEIPCDHEWGDWSVTKEPTESETGLKVRGCNKCSATQEETIPALEDVEEIENIEKEEYLKEEDAILDLDTDLLGEVKGDTEEEKNETTTIYLNVRFDGFGGSAVFTAYDGENNTIVTKTVSGSSNPTLKIPSGEYVKIVCQLTGENASKAKTTFYNASGVFNNESYYLNVKITYKAPCSHTHTTFKTKKEATYKSGGVMEEVCDDCGKIVSSQKTAKLTCSHIDVERTTIREASETHAGIISKKCKQCGKFLGTEEQTKTEHKHDYKASSIAASCDKNGYKVNVCTICGDVKIIETIDKLPHTFNEGVITKNPDCTHDGIKTFTCSVCGATKQEAVVTTGHTYNETSRTEPTCKDEGKIVYTCETCGDSFETKLEKTNEHNWSGEYEVTKPATCSETGVSELRCTVCDKKLDEVEVAKLAHTNEWVTKTEATEEAEGLKEYKCSVCGYVSDSEVIPKLEKQECTHPSGSLHFLVLEEATCSTYRYAKVTCNDCGKVLYDRVKYGNSLNPDNHTHIREDITKAATYSEDGLKTFTCEGCGYSYTEVIPKLICEHTKTGIYYRSGYENSWKKCEICNEWLQEVTGAGIACTHAGYNKTEILRKQATETEYGVVDYVCEHCGQVTTTKKIHPYKEYTVSFADGHTEVVCGWLDNDLAQQVFTKTNEYRVKNGLNALSYNTKLQWASDQRAIESSLYFEHYRPGSTTEKWNTVTSDWRYGGENIASGQKTVTTVMSAWKRSPGHNKNLLYGINSGETRYQGLSVGVFHKLVFNQNTYIPTEVIVWSQNFTFTVYTK